MKKLLLIVSLLVLPAWCAGHSLVITGQTQSVNAQPGDSINLVGDSNQLTVKGNCTSLNITGSNNHIRLDGQLVSVNVVGSNNAVVWVQTANRHAPGFNSVGVNNQITPVAP